MPGGCCRRAKSRTGVGATHVGAPGRRASGACRRCEATGGADPARGEGGHRPLQQEVLRDEGAVPAHHAAEPREHEAEGLAPGPRMADLTLDLQPARTLALPLICRRTIMPMHVSR